MDDEVPGPEGIITGKQDPMAAERIYEKDSNTDLEPTKDEPPAVGERHQSNQESDGEPVNDRVSKRSDRPALRKCTSVSFHGILAQFYFQQPITKTV